MCELVYFSDVFLFDFLKLESIIYATIMPELNDINIFKIAIWELYIPLYCNFKFDNLNC